MLSGKNAPSVCPQSMPDWPASPASLPGSLLLYTVDVNRYCIAAQPKNTAYHCGSPTVFGLRFQMAHCNLAMQKSFHGKFLIDIPHLIGM